MGILIFALLIFAFLFFYFHSRKKMRSKGFIPSKMVINLKYICGHPFIDNPTQAMIGVKDGSLHILSPFSKEIGTIRDVKQLSVEDASTIQRRPTVVRFLAFGIFAFALQKKKKDHLAYLIIEWNDGRFDHETIFEYEGGNALTRANQDRNKIIRQL